ncbi:MAG: DUF4194 domain-containing protein [Proteobacteria bacterium]|nr:MAG: DUF4194 domain-containing protein [Pseudomonadota bacterium]
MESIARAPYANVIIKLLQGPVYSEDKTPWAMLMNNQTSVMAFFARIGLDVVISETDGFARVLQPEAPEDDPDPLPRLMRRVSLNYETTLLAAILREMLDEFDVLSDSPKLFLTQKDIKERIELFYRDQSNRSKLWKDLAKPINSLTSIGVLKLISDDENNKDNSRYELRRIIKSLVSVEKLEEIKQKMKSYVDTIREQ